MSNHYYRPYESDPDTDSDSESEYSSGYTSDTLSDTDTFSGPGSEALTLVVNSGIPKEVEYPERPIITVAKETYDASRIAKETYDASRNTSLIMINSRDRDTNIYPQPTFFTIRMPRIYKNIKSVAITQLNLLNSFFSFSQEKGNTYMYINELGRVNTTSSGEEIRNDTRVQIRNGTYSASELVSELNNALNQTPLFSDLSGGLGTFIAEFQGTGDYSILFNQPGPVVYNSLTGQYESNVTMSQLVARYFQTVQTVGTVNFSYNKCLVAYYYPIIKEMTTRRIPFNNYPEALPVGYPDPYTYILFGFTGLDDPYILTFIQDPANILLFDTFHDQNTFVQFLVNNYVCTYNSLQGRLQVSATSLNPSIQSDLTNEYQTILNEEVVNAGFSNVTDFQTRYNSLSQQNGALLEFYNFIHRQFTNQFGINFGTYTAEFFANLNNEITMYNTINKRGWATTLLPSVSSNAKSDSQITASQISTPLKNIVIRPTDPGAGNFLCNLGSFSTINFSNASETTYGYTDISFSILPTSYARLNLTSRCRQNFNVMTIPRYLTERGVGTDEIYPFGSGLNQTPMLFDVNSIRTDISGVQDFYLYTVSQNMFASRDFMRNANTWINYITPQILAGGSVQPTDPEYNQIPPIGDFQLVSYRHHMFFQLNMDGYVLDPTAKWKVDICVETQDGSRFPTPIVIARYKDRSAFMIDAISDLAQNYQEDPRHVFENKVFTDISAATLTVDVTSFETSYFTVHIQNDGTILSSVPLRVFAILNGTYGEYTNATILDYRGLPWQNLSTLLEQITPNSEQYRNPVTTIYDSAIFQLGYDISGVSNSLLDYYIQRSDNTLFDPNTIQSYESATKTGLRFLFDRKSDGSGPPAPDSANEWSLYFYKGSANTVRDTYQTGSSNVYLNASTILKAPKDGNENILVNWFKAGSNCVEEYRNPAPYGFLSTNTNISLSTGIFLACTNQISRNTDASTSLTSYDTTGLQGLSFFMNPNNIAKINDIQIKFGYIQPSFDNLGFPISRSASPLGLTNTNLYIFQNQNTFTSIFSNTLNTWDDWYEFNRRNIRVGVFDTGYISSASLSSLSFSTAICTLTLEKVTQVANYTNTTGTLRTREPEWGTYYKYSVLSNADTKWVYQNGTWQNIQVSADRDSTYAAGEITYPGYFLTHTNINNYNFIPLGYGIAPSVGYAVNNPNAYVSSYTEDVKNSYTVVPFYYDTGDSLWKVGGFYGNTYTKTPAVPNPATTGAAAPYYGPPGIFGWVRNVSTMVQASTDPYYWNMKIGFEILDLEYDPATDLASFGGYAGISNEYQDTVMFLYANTYENDDIKDISTNTALGDDRWVWGQESNSRYKQWDDQSGYNYLSYITDFTIRPSSIYDYAVHVRGYVPTSQFNTGVRLIGKNYTDFGTATLNEIGQEISDLTGYIPISDALAWKLLNSTNTSYYSTLLNTNDYIRVGMGQFYSHQYSDALIRFNNMFKYPSIRFGKKIGYTGVPFILTGYQNAMNQYAEFYSTLRGTLNAYTVVLSTTTGRLNQYVIDRYADILPPLVLNRTRITDPIPFSIILNSKLESPYNTMFDEWGLGWNLGFKKADTLYLTTQISDTFIRITQDFIYLKLNDEMNLNSLGVSAKEDLSLTREPFSESNKYFAKILLNNFGGFCRAAVILPKIFSPILGQFQTLSLQLMDRNGVLIDNLDCEFDIVMEMTEIMDSEREKFAIIRGS